MGEGGREERTCHFKEMCGGSSVKTIADNIKSCNC